MLQLTDFILVIDSMFDCHTCCYNNKAPTSAERLNHRTAALRVEAALQDMNTAPLCRTTTRVPQGPPTTTIIHVFGSRIFSNEEKSTTFFSL
jgi:hypothetical protein